MPSKACSLNRSRAFAAIVLALVAPCTEAPAYAAGFDITNFAGTNELTLVRDTQILGTRLRLTPPIDSRWGAAWYSDKQPIAQGFTSIFQFQVSSIEAGDIGADGFAFLIQNDSVTALAAGGEDMGYGNYYLTGIQNSLAIEFDLHENDTQADPNSNHVSVQSRGVLENSGHTSLSLGLATPPFSMKDGAVHTVLVQYTPGLLQLSLDGASPILSVPVNLETLLNLDNGRAWVRFTASCGGNTRSPRHSELDVCGCAGAVEHCAGSDWIDCRSFRTTDESRFAARYGSALAIFLRSLRH